MLWNNGEARGLHELCYFSAYKSLLPPLPKPYVTFRLCSTNDMCLLPLSMMEINSILLLCCSSRKIFLLRPIRHTYYLSMLSPFVIWQYY